MIRAERKMELDFEYNKQYIKNGYIDILYGSEKVKPSVTKEGSEIDR